PARRCTSTVPAALWQSAREMRRDTGHQAGQSPGTGPADPHRRTGRHTRDTVRHGGRRRRQRGRWRRRGAGVLPMSRTSSRPWVAVLRHPDYTAEGASRQVRHPEGFTMRRARCACFAGLLPVLILTSALLLSADPGARKPAGPPPGPFTPKEELATFRVA